MGYAILFMATAVGWEEGPNVSPLPEQPEGLVVRLWTDNRRHRMYDPLFVRVTVTNTTDTAIVVGADLCTRADYRIFAGPFSYAFDSMHGGVASERLSMEPGEEWIVHYEILQIPPIRIFDHDIWDDVLRKSLVDLTARVGSRFIEPGWISHSRASITLDVYERPEAEASFLKSLYGEMRRRQEEHFTPDEKSRLRELKCPNPHVFGLQGFVKYEDLVQRLFEYEENLSPGPLRDIVHLTRLMRGVYDETDKAKKVQAVYAVMRFVDTLPQIEQENLLMRISDWWPHSSHDPAYFLLAESALRRLPKNICEYKDYAARRREGWSKENPRFAEYLETVKHIESLIEPEVELNLAPKKEPSDSDDPFRDPDG